MEMLKFHRKPKTMSLLSLAHWFLYKGEERFNLLNLRTPYNDPNPEIRGKMRSAVILTAVQIRDCMSVSDLIAINRVCACAVGQCVTSQTLTPEPYCL